MLDCFTCCINDVFSHFWGWCYLGAFLSFLFTLYYLNPFPKGYKKPTRKAVNIGEQIKFTGKSIPCRNPATGEYLGEDISATADEVNEAVRRAKEAQKEWAAASIEERKAVLYDLLQYVVENQEEICKLSVTDTGKTMMEAFYGEILTTCEKLRYVLAHGHKALQTESRPVPPLLAVKSARVEYHPLGVIGIIIPWNYPFHNAISAITAAVFCGNAAVVKVSEWATFSRSKYNNIFRQVLANRGFNPDLIQLIPGYGDTGAALCKCPDVSKILFIGSPATGKRVMEAASVNLTPVVLELGGKDPFIVFADAEFDHAVEVALRGVFINQGQNCLAAERIYVERSIYKKFCDEITPKVKNLRQGAPPSKINIPKNEEDSCVDCGAMTMPGQVEIVANLVEDAIQKGAIAAVGGSKLKDLPEGALFYPPTVLIDVDHRMRIVNEEAFGPVMLIIPFDNDQDLIEMANGTPYGLGCSIFSTNYKRAEAVGSQIVSGMCTINDFGLSYLIQSLPFGGCKISGFGRFNGVEGLREFSRQKSIVTDRFPFRTKAPRFTQYPVPAKAPLVIQNAVTFLYSGSPKAKITAFFTFVKALLTLDNPKVKVN